MQSKDSFGKSLVILPKTRIALGMCFSDLGDIQKIIILEKPKHFCTAMLLSAGSIHLCVHLNPTGRTDSLGACRLRLFAFTVQGFKDQSLGV